VKCDCTKRRRRRLGISGCRYCKTYRCPQCKEKKPWSNGGTDDDSPFCDECWFANKVAEEFKKLAEQYPPTRLNCTPEKPWSGPFDSYQDAEKSRNWHENTSEFPCVVVVDHKLKHYVLPKLD